MKKQLFALLGMLMSAITFGQVSFSAQVPPYGIVHKDQLWNLVVVSGQNGSVTIQLDVVNKLTNQPVFSATSKTISITKGSNRVQIAEVSPLTYSYYANGGNFQTDGLLPVGEYTACYTLVNTHLKEAAMAQDCVPIQVQLLSPLLLNYPADKSILSEPVSLFSWIPPAPATLLNNPTYDLTMVEVGQGQSQLSAIQQNIPVLSVKNLQTNFYNYTLSAQALDTSKTYAWYITVNNNGQPAGQSDIWSFRYKKQLNTSITESDAFYSLKLSSEAAYAVFSNSLKIIYQNDAGDTITHYSISDLKEVKQGLIAEGDVKLTPGQNFIEMPLSKFHDDRLYVISFVNGRKEQWSLKFIKAKRK